MPTLLLRYAADAAIISHDIERHYAIDAAFRVRRLRRFYDAETGERME